MRVRRQPAARRKLTAEVMELLDRQASLQVGASVDARRCVSLEIDDVTAAIGAFATEEMVEADFVQRGRRGVGGDVPADTVGRPVAADHHRHRVPSHEALDPTFDFLAARQRGLIFHANRVDIRSAGAEREADAFGARMVAERREQAVHTIAVALLDDVVERLAPLTLFECLDL